MTFENLQQHLDYQFNDLTLLERSITHRSYLNEHPEYTLGHNERLEFLGDSVIGYIASNFLYSRFPDMSEGKMTRLRGWLIRTETLASFARFLNFGDYIRMAKGEEDTGGRDRDTVLCNTFEAVMGAVYLDSDLETVTHFILPFFEPVLVDVLDSQKDKDPKNLFQEWSQAVFRITPTYINIIDEGMSLTPYYMVEALIGNIGVGWGEARNKQVAERLAAGQALKLARQGIIHQLITQDNFAQMFD